MNWRHRVRGIAGLAGTWGLALSALATASVVVGLALGVVPSEFFGPREVGAIALRGFAAGAISGALFGWIMASRERGRLLSALSRRRVALWGFAAAGGVIPVAALAVLATSGLALPMGVLAAATGLAGAGGSLFSVGLLWSAQRAPDRVLDHAEAKRLKS